jgi:hypothetical protein
MSIIYHKQDSYSHVVFALSHWSSMSDKAPKDCVAIPFLLYQHND